MRDPLVDPAAAPPTAPDRPAPVTGRPPSLHRTAGVLLASAVLPGSGHLAAGRRRTGSVLLALSLLGLAALAAVSVYARLHPDTAASWAVQPRLLATLKWCVVAAAAVWVAVIVHSTTLTSPGRLGGTARALAGGLAVVLVAAVALPAAVLVHYTDVQLAFVDGVFRDAPVSPTGPTAAPAEEALGDGRLNVLLVGSDAGPDRTGTRTDTVILASLDTRSGHTVLLTLPRNLERVPFAPGSAMAKEFPRGFTCGNDCLLNAVYAYGVEHPRLFPGDPDPGMTALVSAVTATLGIPVDYHAIVDLNGFAKIVDALGGVTLRVDRRLPIGGLSASGQHVAPSGYIAAGLQHMDGQTALWYARSRSDSSDYERVLRQRCLIGAIQRQADPATLLTSYQALATSTADALQTDIPRSLLPALVKLAFKVKQQPVEGLAFTPPLINTGRPDFAAIRGYVQQALQPATAAPSAPPTTPGAPPSSPPATPAPSQPVSVDQVCSYS